MFAALFLKCDALSEQNKKQKLIEDIELLTLTIDPYGLIRESSMTKIHPLPTRREQKLR